MQKEIKMAFHYGMTESSTIECHQAFDDKVDNDSAQKIVRLEKQVNILTQEKNIITVQYGEKCKQLESVNNKIDCLNLASNEEWSNKRKSI